MKSSRQNYACAFLVFALLGCSSGSDSKGGQSNDPGPNTAKEVPVLSVEEINSRFLKMSYCQNQVEATKQGPTLEAYKASLSCQVWSLQELITVLNEVQLLMGEIEKRQALISKDPKDYTENQKNFLITLKSSQALGSFYYSDYGKTIEGLQLLSQMEGKAASDILNRELAPELFLDKKTAESFQPEVCKYAKMKSDDFAKFENIGAAGSLLQGIGSDNFGSAQTKIKINLLNPKFASFSLNEIYLLGRSINQLATYQYAAEKAKEIAGSEKPKQVSVSYGIDKDYKVIMREKLKLDCLLMNVFNIEAVQEVLRQGALPQLHVSVQSYQQTIQLYKTGKKDDASYPQTTSLQIPDQTKLDLNTVDPQNFADILINGAREE
jgi:hypothetical protein